jgi:hypothetical protein
MLTLLATLEFLALIWKLETAFQSIFVFPDSRFHCKMRHLSFIHLSRVYCNRRTSFFLQKLRILSTWQPKIKQVASEINKLLTTDLCEKKRIDGRHILPALSTTSVEAESFTLIFFFLAFMLRGSWFHSFDT